MNKCILSQASTEEIIKELLIRIGEDPTREGLLDTPKRVAKMFNEIYSGYEIEIYNIFKIFNDSSNHYNGLVYLRNIEFYSVCEHHMLPFSGYAMVAYIPNGPVIGASKMARLVDIYSKRLQMQERIGEQVADALMKYLNPVGAACLTEAKHLCMACRGVQKQHSVMGYSSLKGVFLEHSNAGIAARAELMSLWKQ